MDFWRSYDHTVEELAVLLILIIVNNYYTRSSRGDALSGSCFVRQLLESNNDDRIRAFLRMDLATFERLLAWLTTNTNLRSSRYLDACEKLIMFL